MPEKEIGLPIWNRVTPRRNPREMRGLDEGVLETTSGPVLDRRLPSQFSVLLISCNRGAIVARDLPTPPFCFFYAPR